MQGFRVRAVVGLVFLVAVVFHLTMDQPQRLARLRQIVRFSARLERQPAPPGQGSPYLQCPTNRGRSAAPVASWLALAILARRPATATASASSGRRAVMPIL